MNKITADGPGSISTIYRTPFPLQRTQWMKVSAVAVACFSLLALQFRCSLGVSLAISLGCSVITLFSESFRANKNDWFKITEINTTQLLVEIGVYLIIFPICLHFACTALGLPLQFAALKLMEYDLRSIFLAAVLAPIAEEIVFRGFVQERIEDALQWAHQYAPLGERNKKIITYLGQSALFTIAHFRMGQMIQGTIMKTLFFSRLLYNGFYFGWKKDADQSIVSPILAHAGQNIGGIALARLLRC